MGTQIKATLLNWKNKCLAATKKRRQLEARLRRSEQRNTKLRAELAELKQRIEPQRVPHHTYPAQLIALAVFIVVHAKGSLRCAAKTIGYVSELLGWSFGEPSHISVRNWLLRCGLYAMDGGAAKQGDYVGIIDESIQIGQEKLLLLLGVKLEAERRLVAPLSHNDVEVLGMEVQHSWDGEQIADFIKRRMAHHTEMKLRYVISDQGKAILKALSQLKLNWVSDCTHVLMNIVKKLFAEDEQLLALTTQMGELRRKLALTKDSFVLPPSLRNKDRFLRIFTIVDWSDRIANYWPNLSERAKEHLDFLVQAKPTVRRIGQVRELVAFTAKLLKRTGLSHKSRQIWEHAIAHHIEQEDLAQPALAFIEAFRGYFDQHLQLIDQEQRLLCCSDIIESTFGSYKNKGGMKVISADVLSIALYSQTITVQWVIEALTATKHRHSLQWQQQYTCDNRFSLLYRMNQELKTVA